jgi:hypothetical protein
MGFFNSFNYNVIAKILCIILIIYKSNSDIKEFNRRGSEAEDKVVIYNKVNK